jgi:antitoxin MazE
MLTPFRCDGHAKTPDQKLQDAAGENDFIGGSDERLQSIMQVAKWGNSLAVRLPAAVVEALQLKEGDDIEIHVVGDRVFALEKKPGSRELLARLRKYRGRIPADFKFDRLDAHEDR